jgi:hypothetical protein
VKHFDLILVGSDLDPTTHRVALKTNPKQGGAWPPVAPSARAVRCTAQPGLRVIPNLLGARFLGQDIRENYIALRITTTRAAATGTLRAAYAASSVSTDGTA